MSEVYEQNIHPVAGERSSLILNGQLFYVVPTNTGGIVQLDPASDFAQGVKTGPADYDQRLHAFFIATDDLSGGQGFQKVSARDDIGLYSLSTFGVDTRRAKHITAPPYIRKLATIPAAATDDFAQGRSPSAADTTIAQVGSTIALFYPGTAIRSTDGYTFAPVALSGSDPRKLVRVFIGPRSGTMNWYASFLDGDTIDNDLQSWYTSNGTSWSAETKRSLWDVTFADGYYWYLGETGLGISASYPSSTPTGGLPIGRGLFLGMARNARGDYAMYFLKAGRLFFAVDHQPQTTIYNHDDSGLNANADFQFYTVTTGLPIIDEIREVILTPGFNIMGGCWFKNTLYLHNGFSMVTYSVQGSQEVLRDVGFQVFRDKTPELDNGATIQAMCADEKCVYVAVQNSAACYILAYNESGWCLLGGIAGFTVQSMSVGWMPSTGWPTTKRSIYCVGSDGTNCNVYEVRLPALGPYPVVGEDAFARLWDVYTGWQDGGFVDLRGTLYEILAEGQFDNGVYVEVYYMLDGDETETLLGTWTSEQAILHWGRLSEGASFRTFQLRLLGYGGPDDYNITLSATSGESAMGDASARTRLAQSFKITDDAYVTGVWAKLCKVGTPADNFYFQIEADSSGHPSGTPLAATGQYGGDAYLNTEYGLRYLKLAAPVQLTGAVTYWVVMYRSGSTSGSNYYKIQTGNVDANNDAKAFDGSSTWTSISADMNVQVETDKRVAADIKTFVVSYSKRPRYRAQFTCGIDVWGMKDDGVKIDGVECSFASVYAKLCELWDSEELLTYEIPGVRRGLCQMAAMPTVVQTTDGIDPYSTPADGVISLQLLEPIVVNDEQKRRFNT